MEITIFILCLFVPFIYFLFVINKIDVKNKENKKCEVNSLKIKTGKEKPVNYCNYSLSIRERILYIIIASSAIFSVSYLFFNNAAISFCFCPLSLFYLRIKRKQLIRKRKNELNLQFRDALLAISSSLSAGRTIELAFKSAVQDLSMMYPDPNTHIIREMELVNHKIEMNGTVEAALEDLAGRAGLEDIRNFTDIFLISKRSGANLVDVVRNASNIINDKIEIQQDIETLLSQRKLEQKILNIIPIGIMVFLYLTSPDYVSPIYTTYQGRATMVFVLIMLAGSFFISKKIVDIKV